MNAPDRRSVLFAGTALAVATVILGPMLLPGFPLRYDLVSVPRPVLGEDALGLGDRLPRAIPLDSAVALLAAVLPDGLVTQLLGVLALMLAGWGVAVLTPGPLPGRLLALLVAEWNPFVLEQLAIGHLPHLFAYGALPWVAIAARALARAGGTRRDALRDWAALAAAAGFGSLTPGGGVLVTLAGLAGLAAGTFGPCPCPGPAGDDHRCLQGRPAVGRPAVGRAALGCPAAGRRYALAGLGSLLVLQMPWLVAAVAAPAFDAPAGGADSGITAFALSPETGWGRLVDAAGLAGMWNQAALPASRHTVLAPAGTVLLLVLAVAGLPAVRRYWRAGFRAEVLAAALTAAAGYLIAVLPVLPGGARLLTVAVEVMPGAGLLRDGHRWLAPYAVVLAVLCGLGAGEIAARLSRPTSAGPSPGPVPPLQPAPPSRPASPLQPASRSQPVSPSGPVFPSEHEPSLTSGSTSQPVPPPGPASSAGAGLRAGVALLAALLVIASMPDLAGGLAGRLRSRHYPAQWAQVRTVLDRSDDRARVLVLPWQPFRVFSWSGPAPVLDPAPRLLPRQTIVSDALTVSGSRLPEEGPGARAIAADLVDGSLSDESLRSLAVGWVLVERSTPGRIPALPPGWTAVSDGPDLSLFRAPSPLPAAPRATTARAAAVIGSHTGAGLVLLGGLSTLLLTRTTSRRRRRTRPAASGSPSAAA